MGALGKKISSQNDISGLFSQKTDPKTEPLKHYHTTKLKDSEEVKLETIIKSVEEVSNPATALRWCLNQVYELRKEELERIAEELEKIRKL